MPVEHRASIQLTERSTIAIDPADYQSLEQSTSFSELIEAGVISLVRSRNSPYGLRAANQVGGAILEGGIRVTVLEKVDGALRALLKWSLPEDVREVPAA